LSEPDPSAMHAKGQMPTVEQIVARVRSLCDTPKPEGRYPLATYVEGYFLGDITAIVTAAMRSEHLLQR
jgi:hypothetical protein